jgi:hypothetical protein
LNKILIFEEGHIYHDRPSKLRAFVHWMRFSIVIGMLTIGYVELFFANEFLPIELESVFRLFDSLVVCR